MRLPLSPNLSAHFHSRIKLLNAPPTPYIPSTSATRIRIRPRRSNKHPVNKQNDRQSVLLPATISHVSPTPHPALPPSPIHPRPAPFLSEPPRTAFSPARSGFRRSRRAARGV